MPITKVGEDLIKTAVTLPEYLSSGAKGLWDILGRVGTKADDIRQQVKPGLGRGVIHSVAKPVTSASKFLYHRPEVAIPLALGTLLVGNSILKGARKNMYHVDPTYNLTSSTALGGTRYNDPEKIEEYKKQNLLMI